MPTLATWVIAAIVAGFSKGIIEGILKVLFQLGIGFTVYQGIDFVMAQISTGFISNLNALPLAFTQLMGLLKIDKAINVIISAYGVRLVLKGVTNGVYTKLSLKE